MAPRAHECERRSFGEPTGGEARELNLPVAAYARAPKQDKNSILRKWPAAQEGVHEFMNSVPLAWARSRVQEDQRSSEKYCPPSPQPVMITSGRMTGAAAEQPPNAGTGVRDDSPEAEAPDTSPVSVTVVRAAANGVTQRRTPMNVRRASDPARVIGRARRAAPAFETLRIALTLARPLTFISLAKE